jgi:hypothetical protein
MQEMIDAASTPAKDCDRLIEAVARDVLYAVRQHGPVIQVFRVAALLQVATFQTHQFAQVGMM